MKIENKILNQYAQYKTGNYGASEFTDEELEKIEDISLNQLSFSGQLQEIDLSELIKFPNLNILSLQSFAIDEETMENLKNCKNLKTLHLEVCDFDSKIMINFDQLENLIIKYCNVEDWSKISLGKRVTIQSGQTIDLESLVNNPNIEELNLNNLEIYNFKKIQAFEKLKKLNIDGSKVDDEKALDIIKNSVEVSHKKTTYPIR